MQEKNKMSLEGFSRCILLDFQRRLGNRYSVRVTEVTKNNGVKLTGLVIKAPNQNISPTIYLNGYYQHYYDNEVDDDSLKDVEHHIYLTYLKECVEVGRNNVSFEFFRNWETVKDRICCKLVSYKKNEEWLFQVPHFKVLDLALVFYYLYEGKKLGMGSIQIYDTHLAMWGVTKEELLAVAKENVPRLLPCEVVSMSSLIMGLDEKEITEKERAERLFYAEDCPMYIVSNDRKMSGAVYMFDVNKLKQFSEKHNNADVWILPSSVQETIWIPDSGRESPRELLTMVREVNGTCVHPEEVLSNNVYKYVYATGKVVIGGMSYE